MLFRMFRWIFKLALGISLILVLSWFAIRWYFRDIHPIAPRVRADVSRQVTESGGRYLSFNRIPKIYREAVIDTEDRRFASNVGVDFTGIARAVLVDLTRQKPLQGGSTITQQLVHNTILNTTNKSLIWKIQESVYAIGLYDSMSKDEIFTLYANDVYFGHGAYGLENAAKTYFNRPVSQLNAGELTMLAGLPNAPSVYDPFVNMTLARQRQSDVLGNMVEVGDLTSQEANQVRNEPIRLRA